MLAGVSAYVVGESLATLARIGGGPIIGRLGTRRAVVVGASLRPRPGSRPRPCAARPASPRPGLAAAAVGISVVWPLLLADVNNEARHPALAIGGITACGYLGMVAGPPLVGTLSGLFGLRTGLLVLAAIALMVAIVPAHVRAVATARATRPQASARGLRLGVSGFSGSKTLLNARRSSGVCASSASASASLSSGVAGATSGAGSATAARDDRGRRFGRRCGVGLGREAGAWAARREPARRPG